MLLEKRRLRWGDSFALAPRAGTVRTIQSEGVLHVTSQKFRKDTEFSVRPTGFLGVLKGLDFCLDNDNRAPTEHTQDAQRPVGNCGEQKKKSVCRTEQRSGLVSTSISCTPPSYTL